ncbi:MAG: hypothetical protein EHM72_01325 [Calditrichaeota bacterium]|nr:MAG: hypothetical protein EHM72_01325 [Calditrichota bacterium]
MTLTSNRQIAQLYQGIVRNKTNRVFTVGAGSSLAAKSAGAVFLLLAQIVAARVLGAAEYGYFAYAQNLLIILSIFTILGFDVSLLRFIPEYQVRQEWAELKGILSFSFRSSLLFSGAMTLLLMLFLGLFPTVFTEKQTIPLLIMSFSIPLYSLTMIRQSALRGFKHIVLAELPESIIRPLVFILALLIFSRFYAPVDAAQAWLIYLGVVLLTFLIGTGLLVRAIPPLTLSKSETESRQWTRISLDMMWMNAMNVIFNQASLFLLGFYADVIDIAYFSAATRIAFFISFTLTAVNSIAAPMISELYHAQKHEELQNIMRLSAAFLGVVTLFTVLILSLWGKPILGFFGNEFPQAYKLLLLLMLGHAFKSFSGPASFLLNMSGNQKAMGRVMFCFMLFHLVINFLLIPRYAATGAAIATAVTMVLWNVSLAYMSVRFVKIDPTIFSLKSE